MLKAADSLGELTYMLVLDIFSHKVPVRDYSFAPLPQGLLRNTDGEVHASSGQSLTNVLS